MISDRVISIDLKIANEIIKFVAAYLPHDGYGEDAMHSVYNELDVLIKSAAKEKRKIIIGGDFQCDEEDMMRGAFMKSWASQYQLDICNLMVKHDWNALGHF